MSGVSPLPVTGLGTAPPAKPVSGVVSQTPAVTSAKPTVQTAGSNYPSPILSVDPLSNHVIIEYRDQASGTVTQQIPPKDVVRLYQQSAANATAAKGK